MKSIRPILVILYLLTSLVFVSCSTPSHLFPDSSLVSRSLSSKENCRDLVSHFIAKPSPIKNSANSEFLKESNSPTLMSILEGRKLLREKYEKITESIKDFQITKETPVKGKTKLILNPQEGYLAKIMMIRNAKETIDLSYYIFKDDDIGNTLLHEIRKAIKRGVKVRILVDSSGSISKSPFYDDIKALVALSGKEILDENGQPTGQFAKAEAVLFNPLFNVRAHVANWMKQIYNLFADEKDQLPLATFSMNRRSHDKILLIDAQSEENSMAIIGGRNIAKRYYLTAEEAATPTLDAEILIRGLAQRKEDGSIENALENHYNKIYYYLANKRFEDFLIKTNPQKVRKEFKKLRAASDNLLGDDESSFKAKLAEMESNNYLNSQLEEGLITIVNEIQNLSRKFIFLKPKNLNDAPNGNSIVGKFQEELKKAKSSIEIVSPYFWMPDAEIELLIEWAKKDPKRVVRLYSNSISSTDNVIAQALVDKTFKEMIENKLKGSGLESQFEIYAYGKKDDKLFGGQKKYGFLHAKVLLIDRKVLKVSTANFDPISRHQNSEVGVFVENLPTQSTNIQETVNFLDYLQKSSTVWGSHEWQDIRNHHKTKILMILQAFVTKIIYTFNLEPIL